MSTFGQITPGGGWQTLWSDYNMGVNDTSKNNKQGCKFTLTDTGDVTKVSMYLRGTNSSLHCHTRALIYEADSGGYPAVFRGGSVDVDISGAPGAGERWVDFTFSPVLSLTPGDYWICFFAGGPSSSWCLEIAYDFIAGQAHAGRPDAFADGPSDPFGTLALLDANVLSIYATYTITVVNATVVSPVAVAIAAEAVPAAVFGVVAPAAQAIASRPAPTVTGNQLIAVAPALASAAAAPASAHASRVEIGLYPEQPSVPLELVEDP